MLPRLGEAPCLYPLTSNHGRKVLFYLMIQSAKRMLRETIVSYMLRHDLNLDLVYLVNNNNNKKSCFLRQCVVSMLFFSYKHF